MDAANQPSYSVNMPPPIPHDHEHSHTHGHLESAPERAPSAGHGAEQKHSHQHGHGHDQGHNHDHDHHSPTGSSLILGIAFALTASFMVVEFAGGLFARSLALLADAGHMLTDAAALALAWTATRIAARPADPKRSFGYQRFRVIAAFVNGCALLFIVAWIAFEAVQRLTAPLPVNASAMLWIGGLGLAVNLIVFALLSRGDQHDMNLSAATLHVLGDLLGSVAAICAALIIIWTGWLAADPLLSLAVCALIVRSALAIVRRSAHILMEGSPDWLDVAEMRRALIERIPGIRDVHHVHAWLVGPQQMLLTMHVIISAETNHAAVLRLTHQVLAESFGITHATVQVEVETCVDEFGVERPCGEITAPRESS